MLLEILISSEKINLCNMHPIISKVVIVHENNFYLKFHPLLTLNLEALDILKLGTVLCQFFKLKKKKTFGTFIFSMKLSYFCTRKLESSTTHLSLLVVKQCNCLAAGFMAITRIYRIIIFHTFVSKFTVQINFLYWMDFYKTIMLFRITTYQK